MKQVTPAKLSTDIHNVDVLLVEFFTKTCAPCRAMEPVLRRIDRYVVAVDRIDVGEYFDVTTRYKITAVPTVILYVDGREVVRRAGAATFEQLLTMINRARS